MKKFTKLSIQWFYNLIEEGECDILDFKEQLDDKLIFGKSLKSFSNNYSELAKDVVAFANLKGGFIFLGIVDQSKEINTDFKVNNQKIFDLIKQIQDRTEPTITIAFHKVKVNNTELVILEIPFSQQLHRTSKGEYLIRSNDGNRAIEPHELATIQSEKNLIIYDQKIWKLKISSTEKDQQGVPVPGWQSIEKTRDLYHQIKLEKPQSPYLKSSQLEFTETLGLVKEENNDYYPTTTGLLFIGNTKAIKEIPYNQIKYIRYDQDGSYKPFEYSGDIISIANECFNQLKSEIKTKELHFGLFREYIEDYPEIVLRELLINAIAHRDYSRQQIIEIRKYPTYIEFESPGTFPDGVNEDNYLRKTNPRNPNIMDVLREVNYAEKAGSGFDKIFTALLSKGKSIPKPIQTDTSVIFRVDASIYSEKLIEISYEYKKETGQDVDLETILVLNQIYIKKKIALNELSNSPYVNKYQVKQILDRLIDLEFIETTGKTSGLKYLIHKSKLKSSKDKRSYLREKKQEKFKQIETIFRYLDEFKEIDNKKVREILDINQNRASYVSRLLGQLVKKGEIYVDREIKHNQRIYKRVKM